MSKSAIRRQTQTISIPTATAAGTLTFNVTLDSNYKYANKVFVNQGAGTDQMLLGFSDASANYSDPVPLAFWASDLHTPSDKRAFPLGAPAGGNVLTVTISLPANAASNNTIYVTYELADEPLPAGTALNTSTC